MIYTEDRHLNYSIKRIMLSNFKTFKGEHWFDIEDITLITGANNSGKSSLINGLKLFSDAFTRSDLPYLDKSAVDGLGGWDDIINHDAESVIIQKQEHKILGFGMAFNVMLSKEKEAEVVLKYEFVYNEYIRTFSFSKLLLFIDCEKPFLTLVRSWLSQNVIETNNDYTDIPGEIYYSLDLEMLSDLIGVNSHHNKLIDYLKSNFGDLWVGELFSEETYFDNNWANSINFDHLINEMFLDEYMNLINGKEKNVFFSEELGETLSKEYNKNKEELGYRNFLNDLYKLFHHVQKHLRLVSREYLAFVSANEIYHSRIIINSDKNRFLNAVLNIQERWGVRKPWTLDDLLPQSQTDQEFPKETFENHDDNDLLRLLNSIPNIEIDWKYKSFIQRALDIFSINGFLTVEKVEDQGYIIKLITDHKEINMADLGKGNAKLFIAILKAASVMFDETKRTPDIGIESDYNYEKILFFEEPEAFLHPNWQSRFADFIALCYKKNRVKIIIETHSEYLVRKLQYLVAKEEINKDRVLIYYLNNPKVVKEGEPSKRIIKIKETGQLSAEFGPGFYDESVHLMMGLLDDELLN